MIPSCTKCGGTENIVLNNHAGTALCIACCDLLQVPYVHPVTKRRIDFGKIPVIDGAGQGYPKRGRLTKKSLAF